MSDPVYSDVPWQRSREVAIGEVVISGVVPHVGEELAGNQGSERYGDELEDLA